MQIQSLQIFDDWLAQLRDRQAKSRIIIRVRRLGNDNPDDHRGLGGGLFELRIDCGPGYRVYYVRRGDTIVLLLCGGDKSTQSKDIERAQALKDQLNGD